MTEEFFRWLITLAIVPSIGWVARTVLKFVEKQQERADQAHSRYMDHLTKVSDECAAERTRFWNVIDNSLREHTEHSKALYRKLAQVDPPVAYTIVPEKGDGS